MNNVEYAELQTSTNFSFLQGASHPEEYIQRAAELGYRAIATTDRHSLAGIVRCHQAAKKAKMKYIIGCRLELQCRPLAEKPEQDYCLTVLVYPQSLSSYGRLCELLTLGKRKTDKDNCLLILEDFLAGRGGRKI
jgi:error-prone DNA polymerase